MGCYEIKHESTKNQYILDSIEEDNESEDNDKIINIVTKVKNKITSNNTCNSSTREYQLGKSTFTIARKVSEISDISGNEIINQKPSPISKDKQDLTIKGFSFDKYKHIFSGTLPENTYSKRRKYKKEKANVQ
jgi:hypothetical protein